MKVLLIGSGAREHALTWKLKQSALAQEIFCAPGNPGMSELAKCVPIKVDNISELTEFALKERIDLTVVGPELPLSLGVVDAFRARGLKVFGPTKAAAQLEASKSFAKEIMHAARVPTAVSQVFEEEDALRGYLKGKKAPLVLKADGLASGKGVFVCLTQPELDEAVSQLFSKLKASKVVVEDYLVGNEVSYIVATDGKRVVPCASSHDYKRIFDNQQGPNTGGMGAVSPSPYLSAAQEEEVLERVIYPVIREMERRGTPFSGFLYAGLMLSPQGEVNVLEFNARMGDPECQVIMRRLDSDLAALLFELSGGNGNLEAQWSSKRAVCVVLAADGYPENVKTGDEISGVELTNSVPETFVFHAGTALNTSGKLVTSGGRVLSVTATGKTQAEARAKAYQAADLIQFRGRQARRDIG